MASAQFQIQVDGGGYGTAGVQATASSASVINCRLASTEGVKSVEWSFHGTHAAAATIPTITLSGTPNGQIATFTLPAGVGQAYGIQCDVNGGAQVTQDDDTTSKSAVRVAFTNTRLPVFVNETFEEDATHAVVPKINDLLASIDGGGAGVRGYINYTSGTHTFNAFGAYVALTGMTTALDAESSGMSQPSNGLLQNDSADAYFDIHASVAVEPNTHTGGLVVGKIYVDGVAIDATQARMHIGASSDNARTLHMHTSAPVLVQTGEDIDVRISASSAGTIDYTYLQISAVKFRDA